MNNKNILNETFQKHIKLLHKKLNLNENINENFNPFGGSTGEDFEKIQHLVSDKQMDKIKKLVNADRSLSWVFTGWNADEETISIESHDHRHGDFIRNPITINRHGFILS